MSAFEFVREKGIEVARVILCEIPLCAHSFIVRGDHGVIYLQKVEDCFYWYNKPRKQYDYYGLVGKSKSYCLIDLKRIVESHELVDRFRGIEKVNHELKLIENHSIFRCCAVITAEELRQAISDVEACQ